VDVAGEGWTEAVTEFHIVGGLHPELTLDWYCEMLRGLKERFPQVHLKAFTMVEIGYLAQRTKISAREVLERLRDAAWTRCRRSAEIFCDRVRRVICDQQNYGRRMARDRAHRARLRSAFQLHDALRPLETDEDRVDHLLKLRALQDETQGFVTFIPLAFSSGQYAVAATSPKPRAFWTSRTSPWRV